MSERESGSDDLPNDSQHQAGIVRAGACARQSCLFPLFHFILAYKLFKNILKGKNDEFHATDKFTRLRFVWPCCFTFLFFFLGWGWGFLERLKTRTRSTCKLVCCLWMMCSAKNFYRQAEKSPGCSGRKGKKGSGLVMITLIRIRESKRFLSKA